MKNADLDATYYSCDHLSVGRHITEWEIQIDTHRSYHKTVSSSSTNASSYMSHRDWLSLHERPDFHDFHTRAMYLGPIVESALDLPKVKSA